MSSFKSLYPWEGQKFEVLPNLHMHYLDEGAGEPLLMLHGNPTWSFYYRNLVKAFQGSYRVIAPDHMGCGLSDKPSEDEYDFVLRQRVDDIEKLVAHLGISHNLTLVLHDWGGMIGLALATRLPHLVKRLVLFNTAGFGLPKGKKLAWQISLARNRLATSLVLRGLNLFSRGANIFCSTRPGRMTKPIRQAYLAPYNSWHNRIAVQRFVQDIPLSEEHESYPIVKQVSDQLANLQRVPTLICWGERDFVFDLDFLAEFKTRLPSAEIHSFKDAGHYVLEDAYEEIIPLMNSFFSRHPVSTAEQVETAVAQ